MSYFTPPSFWEYDTWLSPVDIAIIGGGIVGMQAALRLKTKNPKAKITIVERSSLGTAASTRNAGFACYGSPSEILGDLQEMSTKNVIELVRRRVKGLDLLRSIVGDEALQYEPTGGNEIFTDKVTFEYHLDRLHEINGLLAEIGDNLSFQQVEIPDYLGGVVGILSNQWEGQIHPGAMTGALRSLCTSKGIHVLTNFEVLEISRGKKIELVGKAHKLLAEKLIICNNAFAKQLLPLATTAVRNQVLLTEEIPDLQMKGCFHYNQGYVYFRNVGHRILIGGARNIDEERETTSTFGETAMIQGFLRSFLEKHILPGQPLIVEHSWSGILGFNESKEPIIKEVGPGMFVAVGLGGMGVAIGSLIGKEVADLLLQS